MRSDPHSHGASHYVREAADAYHTIDPMCVETLLKAWPIDDYASIMEPCAGRGHIAQALIAAGHEVQAQDLHAHADPVMQGIKSNADAFDITSLAGFTHLITNFPYNLQDKMLAHLLPIAARDGVRVATLTRAAWHLGASKRKDLVHNNPYFAGIITLPRRPWWTEDRKAAPRFEFCWNIWDCRPRGARPFIIYPK